MPLHYFQKIVLSTQLKVGTNFIQWESVGNNTGVKVLDDANIVDVPIITALGEFADKQTRGVRRISAEIYEQKKNNPSPPSVQHPQIIGQNIRVLNKEALLPKAAAAASPVVVSEVDPAAAAVVAPTTPEVVAPAKSTFKPKTAKQSEVKTKTDAAAAKA